MDMHLFNWLDNNLSQWYKSKSVESLYYYDSKVQAYRVIIKYLFI